MQSDLYSNFTYQFFLLLSSFAFIADGAAEVAAHIPALHWNDIVPRWVSL